jgi:hypothetical protein
VEIRIRESFLFLENLTINGCHVHFGDNLRYLEDTFHAKHPQYTRYFREKLHGIVNSTSNLTMVDIINNRHRLIDQA